MVEHWEDGAYLEQDGAYDDDDYNTERDENQKEIDGSGFIEWMTINISRRLKTLGKLNVLILEEVLTQFFGQVENSQTDFVLVVRGW